VTGQHFFDGSFGGDTAKIGPDTRLGMQNLLAYL
jgi:hypothetical protein